MKKNATKTGKARIPEVVADEKDFASVLDIITTHRSRALMSVNVESLPSQDIFQLATGKCVGHEERGNIFQTQFGKCYAVIKQGSEGLAKGMTVSYQLSWSHYLEILKCSDEQEIGFYVSECARSNWNVRELRRQEKERAVA